MKYDFAQHTSKGTFDGITFNGRRVYFTVHFVKKHMRDIKDTALYVIDYDTAAKAIRIQESPEGRRLIKATKAALLPCKDLPMPKGRYGLKSGVADSWTFAYVSELKNAAKNRG